VQRRRFTSWPHRPASIKYTVNSPNHRVHTEWQCPISSVHPTMMEKSALAGEDGGCTPSLFYSSYHHVQSCSERPNWEGRYTSPSSSLPLYVLCVPNTDNALLWVKKYIGQKSTWLQCTVHRVHYQVLQCSAYNAHRKLARSQANFLHRQ